MPGISLPPEVRAAYVAIRAEFEELRGQQAAANPLAPLVRTIQGADSDFNLFMYLLSFADFREWVGQRMVRGLKGRVHRIAMKEHELTIGVDRREFDRARGVNRQTIVDGMAESYERIPRKGLIDLLLNGHQRPAFDGQNFYDTDHPLDPDNPGAGVQSNYEAAGFPLIADNFRAARARLRGFKTETGNALNANLNLYLVHPPELEAAAEAILRQQTIAVAGGTQVNTLYNAATPIILPELSAQPTAWHLLDASGGLKPFVELRNTRTRFQPVEKTSPTDDNVFWHKEYIFGADLEYGIDYGAWAKAFKGVG